MGRCHRVRDGQNQWWKYALRLPQWVQEKSAAGGRVCGTSGSSCSMVLSAALSVASQPVDALNAHLQHVEAAGKALLEFTSTSGALATAHE
eukprot:12938058-Prorocentrum_lima.AAC.1